MAIDPGKLARFNQTHAAYQRALGEADTLRRVRDQSLLALRRDGATLRDLVGATGLSLGRVQQIVKRAERGGGDGVGRGDRRAEQTA